MKRRSSFVFVVVMSLALLALPVMTGCAPQEAAPSPAAPAATEVIKPESVGIAAFVDMTGPMRAMSYPGHVGYITYWRWLNETQGGIDGVPINYIEIDTAYDIKKMRSGYERYKDEVVTLEAQGQSPFYDSLMPRLIEDKMPAFCNIGGSDAFVYPSTGWLYGAVNTTDLFGTYAQWVLKNWTEDRKPRVAFLLGDYPGGRFPLLCPPYLEAQGIEVVATELLPFKGLTSTMDQLLRIVKAEPDFIFTTIVTHQLVIVLDELHGLGIELGSREQGKDFELFTSYGFDQDMRAAMRPENWDGLIACDMSWDFQKYGDPDYPFYTLMVDKYMEYYDVPQERLAPSIAGFAGGMLMAEAIRLAVEEVGWENLTSEAVGLYGYPNIKDFDTGLCPPITFSKDDGRQQGGLLFRTYEDGSTEELWTYTNMPWVFKWLDEHGFPIVD